MNLTGVGWTETAMQLGAKCLTGAKGRSRGYINGNDRLILALDGFELGELVVEYGDLWSE